MSYSIVIRTLGKAGVRYKRMLNCIRKLSMRPDEIIIVIPDGYELPHERLGDEVFVRSRKGMLYQRCAGANLVKSEFILFLDDDLEFQPDLVDKLDHAVKEEAADAAFPFLEDLLPHGKSMFNSMIVGSAVPMLCKSSNKFLKILRTGGYSYNRYINKKNKHCFISETGPGACIYIKRKTFQDTDFLEEDWLEKNGYAMGEDQTFFYKMYLKNYKAICITNATLIHLDAKTSLNGDTERWGFGTGWFKFIFWKRFIYDTEKNCLIRLYDFFSFYYSFYSGALINQIKGITNPTKKVYAAAMLCGKKEAKEFVKSDKYKKYAPIYPKLRK